MLLVLFYMLEHTTMESWMLRGFRFDKYFIVKTHQSLVRYSPFMFVSSWHNFNSLHRVLPTLLMLICEFATTVCAILYCNVCFWSIEYLTNVMCNSHRKLAPRLLKRRCVVQHGTRHHDDVCVVFFNEFFFFFKTQAERRRALLVPSLNMSLSGLFTFWLTQVYKTNFLVILLYRYGLFFTKNANTAI